jgi:acyl carrier protein
MNSTLDELRQLIQESFDIDASAIDPARSVLEYGLDSLALTEFLFTVEDHFRVDLSERDDTTTSLGGLAALIDRIRNAPRSAGEVAHPLTAK